MSAVADLPAYPARIRAGAVQHAAIRVVLVIQSGALLPLMAAQDGALDEAARAMLRLTVLPVYGITLILAACHARRIVTAVRQAWLLVALVALPMLSVLWSIGPSISLRRAVALILSLILSQVLAVMFTPRQLMAIVAQVTALCLAASLAMMVVDPGLAFMPDDTALRGIYMNKNVLGWVAALATVAGGVMATDAMGGRRGQGMLAAGLGLTCLILSQSSTSLVAAAAGLAIAGCHVALGRTGGLGRGLLLMVLGMTAGLLALFLGTVLVPVLDALGKDATLTGRVPLWQMVDARIALRPWLGYGYQTFWTEGSPDAWVIWTAIGWQSPHAHNGYRDIALNLGAVGLTVAALVIAQAIWRGGRLSMAAAGQGWVWPNALLGQSLIINLSESTLLFHNDLQWILTAAVITMIALHAGGGAGRVADTPLGQGAHRTDRARASLRPFGIEGPDRGADRPPLG